MTPSIPRLVGVVHLPPLPGSPRSSGSFREVVRRAAAEAEMLARSGFDGVMIENFGDAPFFPDRVPEVTVAAMSACAVACREAAPNVLLGINVLRNDARAALAIARICEANMVRINVHVSARVTDQGLVEGRAHETLRLRRELGLERVALLCDVDVKHSAPLAGRPLSEEAHDLVLRGLADAVLVTGSGTGRGVAKDDLGTVRDALDVPVLVASGATIPALASLTRAHGVVVGSALRKSGRAGDPVDEELAAVFAETFWRLWEPNRSHLGGRGLLGDRP